MLKPHERHFIGFLLRHLVYGVTGGFVFGGILIAQDFGSIRTMAFASDEPFLWLFLLFFGLFVTFGSIGMAIGIMTIPDRDRQ